LDQPATVEGTDGFDEQPIVATNGAEESSATFT
jgi:hypothetical protein